MFTLKSITEEENVSIKYRNASAIQVLVSRLVEFSKKTAGMNVSVTLHVPSRTLSEILLRVEWVAGARAESRESTNGAVRNGIE